MASQPLCEVFGYSVDDFSAQANRHRQLKLCPFKNDQPCTKNKADDPLGVCSMWEGDSPVIICPTRFMQGGQILTDTKKFLLPNTVDPQIVYEVRLVDSIGQNIGRIDGVFIEQIGGHITDFGPLEIQAVYISGNIRHHFEYYIADPEHRYNQINPDERYPRPDWLSSVKRIVHQFNAKGTILISAWGKRMALVAQTKFYDNFTLIHGIPQVDKKDADIGIFLYEHLHDEANNSYNISLEQTIYINFDELLKRFSSIQAGNVQDFITVLEEKARPKVARSRRAA